MATLGTTKTAAIGKQLTVATTEDGSGFYNVDTTAGSFTTTLDTAVTVGQQERFKQANGSWAVNWWMLTSKQPNGLKFVSAAGTVGAGVTTAAFTGKGVGEVVAEWDGAFWQITQLAAVLGGLTVTQALPVVTQNALPALSAPWNGVGVPTLNVNGNVIANGALVNTTATAASTTATIAVASTAGIASGQLVAGTGVPSGTTVVSVSGSNVTVSQAVNVANAAALTFTSAVVFASGSTTVTFTPAAAGFNVNPGDSVVATFTA